MSMFLVCPDCYALNIYEGEVIPFDGFLLPTEYMYVYTEELTHNGSDPPDICLRIISESCCGSLKEGFSNDFLSLLVTFADTC